MKRILILICMTAMLSLVGCAQYVAVGPNWRALYDAPDGGAATVSLSTERENLKVGEKMSFKVSSDKPGKLWLITVGPDDVKRLVFPNRYTTDNSIAQGKSVYLPDELESWSLRASEPVGNNLVVAIVTGRDAQAEDVRELLMSPDFTKSMTLRREPLKYGLSKLIVTVKR